MSRWLYAAIAFQVALVLLAVGPRLLPRISGDEYRIAVEPVDPIDPFRGAYVDLAYEGFRDGSSRSGAVWVPLRREGDAWATGRPVARRPDGPAIRCRSDDGEVRCGIESFFASQRTAKRLEGLVAEGAVARVKIDGAGRAAIVGLERR